MMMMMVAAVVMNDDDGDDDDDDGVDYDDNVKDDGSGDENDLEIMTVMIRDHDGWPIKSIQSFDSYRQEMWSQYPLQLPIQHATKNNAPFLFWIVTAHS